MATDHDGPDPLLSEAIRGLRDTEPDHDLWPGISNRIAPRKPRVLELRWPVAAAAAMALLAGGAFLSRIVVPGGEAAPGTQLAQDQANPPQQTDGVAILPVGFDRAEATLTEAIDQLDAAYRAAAPTLDPQVRAAIAETLASLDTAIVDARTRAGAAPSDIDAARYLTRTMQRKLSVLRTAANMASHS